MTMTSSELQYFSLMRAALWGSPVSIDGDIDWREVMRIAQHHATTVLVADVASRLPEGSRPPEDSLAKMKSAMRSNLFGQLESKQMLSTVVTALREKGIDPVLLKGFSLARLYPNPVLRQFGDIDLYVGLDHFHEACAVVRSLSGAYTWCMEVDSGRHYNVEFGKTVFEIHRVSADVTDPKEREVYAAIEQDGLKDHPQRVDLDGLGILVPSNEFIVFFTFYHAWHHFLTTGVGWRQVSDVVMALHAYYGQLDSEKLCQWLESMHLLRPWQTFGYLMVACLGLPVGKVPFFDVSCRRRAKRLYRRIMSEGNFKRKRNFKLHRPKRRLWQKLHAFICIFIDFFHLASVFPRQAFMELCTSLKQGFRKNF